MTDQEKLEVRVVALETEHRVVMRSIDGQLTEIKVAVRGVAVKVGELNDAFLVQPQKCMGLVNGKIDEVKTANNRAVRIYLGIPAVLAAVVVIVGALVAIAR